MSDLDLDELERKVRNSEPYQVRATILTLIKRVRKAEAEVIDTYADWHTDIVKYEARLQKLKQVLQEIARGEVSGFELQQLAIVALTDLEEK